MSIAYLDAVHILKYTRPGSRVHQSSRARVAVPVEIPEIDGASVRRVATVPLTGYPGHGILLHGGRLVAPVFSTRYPLRTDSLELRDRELVLGRGLNRSDTIVQGGPGNPDRASLEIGRIVSDTVEEAIERTRRVAANLLTVDGVLHERTHPPAWSVTRTYVDHMPHIRLELCLVAYPGAVSDAGGGPMAQIFSLGRREEALACADAMALMLGWPRAPDSAPVEVLDADACAIDDIGTSAAYALQSAIQNVGLPDFPHLSDATLKAFMAVRAAARISEDALTYEASSARRLLGELRDALAAHPDDVPGASHDLPGLVAHMRRATEPFILRFDRFEQAYRASAEEDLDAVGDFTP